MVKTYLTGVQLFRISNTLRKFHEISGKTLLYFIGLKNMEKISGNAVYFSGLESNVEKNSGNNVNFLALGNMERISGNTVNISGSPVSINFADVDKLRLKKPQSELLPCYHPVSVRLTAAETAVPDIFVTLTG